MMELDLRRRVLECYADLEYALVKVHPGRYTDSEDALVAGTI